MEWLTVAMNVLYKLGVFMSGLALVAVAIGVTTGLLARFGNRNMNREWVNYERNTFKAAELAVLAAGCWAALTYGVDLVRGSAWWSAMLADNRTSAISASGDAEATGFLLSLGGLILVWVFVGALGLRRPTRPVILNRERTEKPARDVPVTTVV